MWPLPLTVEQGYLLVFGGLLAWMLLLELLSRGADSPLYDGVALGGLVLASLLLVRLVLARGGPPWDVSWIGRALSEAANWRGGLPPQLVLIGLNVLLWQRASSATSRDLNFFSVGVTFRSGLLLLLLGGSLLSGLQGITAIGLLWLYMALGLAAVAISRVSEKAIEAQSAGRLLPFWRLIQVGMAVGAAILATWLFSLAYTSQGISSFFRLFDPAMAVAQAVGGRSAVLLGPAA